MLDRLALAADEASAGDLAFDDVLAHPVMLRRVKLAHPRRQPEQIVEGAQWQAPPGFP
ncbi:MAG: hypothetical protein AMXMBFR52_33290 [Burkholderiales bacterium]